LSWILIAEQSLNGLQFGLMLFLLAAGLTLVFGIMDMINLAHGSLYMLGAFLASTFVQLTGSFTAGVLLAIPATALLGMVLEMSLLRTLYARDHLAQPGLDNHQALEDCRCLLGCVSQRRQQHQQNRKRDPADVLEEVLDNVVDQDVAVGEVFRRLDPHRLAADSLANARAVDGRAVLAGFQKLNRGCARVGGKYRRLVLQRREQGFSLIIDHGVGVSPIGLRIEALKIGRKFKREAAVGLRHQMLGEGQGLLFHCVTVDVVGRHVQ